MCVCQKKTEEAKAWLVCSKNSMFERWSRGRSRRTEGSSMARRELETPFSDMGTKEIGLHEREWGFRRQ